jgi:hypothetical protein
MRILNKNTFVDEEVTFKTIKKNDNDFTLIYIGKSCYSLQDLKRIISKVEIKDFNDSLNYRIKKYNG